MTVLRCYRCGGPHFVKDCPNPADVRALEAAWTEDAVAEVEASIAHWRDLQEIAQKEKVEEEDFDSSRE